ELKILKTFSENKTFEDCAKSLNIDLEKLGEQISLMREKGLLRKTEGYEGIRRQAKRILFLLEMVNSFDEMQKDIKNILKRLET
ncbi:MAG: hypothetical protein QW134_03160, partial [Nitrososphaeria archaeon]